MTQKTLVIDLDRCIGCGACEVSCKMENDVPLGVYYNRVLSIGPIGTFPNIKQYFLPSVCQNCREAPCVTVCPTGASYKTEDGQVLINKDKCIGCKMCMVACPYGALVLVDEDLPILGQVHRLQDVHGGLPLRCALLQRGNEGCRKVHAVPSSDGGGRRARLREGLLRQGALLRRH